jgi:predicted site-specific integrase-resolvase
MPLSPAKAAEIAGVSRSLISREVKSGKLVGTKNNRGHISIEVSDLEDWMSRRTERAAPIATQPERTPTTEPVARHEDTAKIAALEVEVREVRNQLTEMRSDRDEWRDQAKQLSERLHSEIRPKGLFAWLFRQ